jgi:heat shock protein HtpX
MYTAVAANKRKTIVLMAVFVAFISALGYLFSWTSHSPGLFYVFGIGALLYSVIMYFASARVTLALTGAKPVAKADAPELYRLVENLSITAGLPMPEVYIVSDPSPNAFATGRDPKHAVVAVTSGLLERLDKEELEGVLAHELGHVGNYDIRLMSVVAALVSVISIISDLFVNINIFGGDDDEAPSPIFFVIGIATALLAPLVATVIQLAVSRRREYLADATAVMLTRYPDGLIGALRKISHAEPMQRGSGATAHLFIANPLGGKSLSRLFSTHPPIEDRIRRLQEMGGRM